MADRFGTTKDGRALHRGTGCHICRQRKVRCDGARPACGRCVKSRAECTYDEEVKKSKITLLRDEISELKKRIQELEGGSDQIPHPPSIPQQSLSPVAVPVSSWGESPALSDAHSINSFANHFNILTPDQKPLFNLPGAPQISLTTAYQPMPSAPGFDGFQAPMLRNAAAWRTPSPNNAIIFNPLDQPLTIEQTLHYLQIIMPYRLQCAFEIDLLSFRESLEDPDPNNQPHDALINAIALMACYYDQALREANRAQFFVERTRRSLQLSLTGVRSHKVIQQIQAGHLLSCYLYWTGSLLEGHAALAGAVSLARLCNLHKITSSDWRSRGDNMLEEPSPYRPQLRPLPSILDHSRARNAIEHGERIHCFWNLLLVDTGGSVSTGYPCQFTASDSDPGTKIETVYPLALHQYMSVSARAQEPTSSYGDIFNPRYVSAQHDTPLVARIKAALLLHRAARLGTVGKTAQIERDNEFSQQWFNLSQCIESFISTLRPIPISAETRPRGEDITEERREFVYMFIAWSLALCARVVMYSITPVAWRDTQRQAQAWNAADHIVQLIQTAKPSEDEMRMLDVMVGFSWMTAANFLINMRNTYEQKLEGPDNFNVSYVERLLDVLDHAAMQLAKTCRPVVRQAQGTREFRARSAGPYQAAPVQAPQTWTS
ncbi:fungal Zn, 2-cys(6) binuclear cluster domain protein [Rhizoctonia solani AG-3 Rhs1AP]|uniref:Fungal Zn, 2-cys(6) binuclear cluster domain protein n=3 Tax=Rhizoctonia solani TaxID=456999 RepID=A0A074RU92_9AGAM|nr:fungal Zn, 2-cys(6) binuclear cluster domain protein [Rhizoctonia solani AG-3 Rhs1AP]KEP50479.1 fungal Zn, 2-cys(6) binuclear cluster domain protein [Rhizoctonia solani 123E]